MSVNYYDQITGAITNIEEAKSSIANAIAAKGVTVPSDASLGAYAGLIMDISTGGTPVPTPTPDVSTRYGIKADAMYTSSNNAGLFNTGYIPGPDTIVQFSGTLIDNGDITHGSIDNDESSSYGVYRMFGLTLGEEGEQENKVFFDRSSNPDGDNMRLEYDVEDYYHNYEFGNYYIKIDDVVVTSSQTPLNSSWSTNTPISIFGGLNRDGSIESIAGEGGDCACFRILEPVSGGDPQVVKEYIPANDASGNICWYETISHTFLYPTGAFSGTCNPREDPYIYELNDSSTTPTPTPTPDPTPDSSSDSSADSSIDSSVTTYDYISVGGDNGAYFNTGYVPTKDTVVKFQGTMLGNGEISHGVWISDAEEQGTYRIFGLGETVFFDREAQGSIRITAELSSLENHEYEFGNYYIKVDNSVVVTGTTIEAGWSLPSSIPICIFGGLDESGNIQLAGGGESINWFEIWEPVNETLAMQKRYVPAIDSSDNACLYESVSGSVLYPTGTPNFNVDNDE